ncbi:hypothetical protein MY10362_009603 [Beauveria mimosiformis]
MAAYKYELASTNADGFALPIATTTKKFQVEGYRRLCIWLLALLAVAGISIVSALTIRDYGREPAGKAEGNRQTEECGTSPAEARQLGCVFDIIIMGWTPDRCHDGELSAEFLAKRDWKFFAHANTTQPALSAYDIVEGEWDNIYVDYEFQLFHCVYLWRKTQRATIRDGILDGYTADPHVVNHCEATILDETFASPSAYVKYSSCPWVPSDSGRLGWYRVMDGKKVHRQA